MVPDTVKDDIQAIRDELTGGTLDVNIASGGAGNGAILDGADSNIKATVKDLTNANPVTVAIVDGSGDQITSFGGGTQYTEGDTAATIVGTAMMWEDTGDTLRAVSAAKPLPISDAGGAITVDGTVAVTHAALTELGDAINSNKVDVNIVSSSVATGGTSAADDDDFTDGTTSGTPAMGVYESTPTTVTDGDMGLVGITSDRRLKVYADLSATDNAVLDNIDADLTTVIGHVDGIETLIGTTNTTLTTIDGRVDGIEGLLTTIDGDTGNIVTSVQLLDDTVATDGSATPTKGILMAGQDGTNAQTVKTDSDGNLQVDVLTMPTTTITGTVDLGATDNAVLDTIDAVLDTINAKLVTGTDIGDVTINNASGASAVNIQDGGNTITVDGTVAVTNSDITSIKTATELIDNSIYVDDADWTADTSSHTLVGAVTQVTTTANTDGDTTPLTTNAFRELRTAIPESDLATAGTSHVKKYYTNAGAVTDGIVWSPAAGKRWYVTDLIINVSAACTVTLEDDKAGGDEAVMKFELAANSGVSHTFNTPWFSGEDAADLLVTTSAGNIYVTVCGYEL